MLNKWMKAITPTSWWCKMKKKDDNSCYWPLSPKRWRLVKYFEVIDISSLLFWRRQWHPTPVLLPRKSHGRRSLEGCSPWDHWGSGSLRVGHDWATSFLIFTFMHWRRKWQPTPVFLPGESQGQGSLVGCCLWGHRVGHDWSDLA